MKRAILIPAALAPAALAELKDWLGLSIPVDDAQLAALLRAVLDVCEAFTGLMPLEQTCETVLPATPEWHDLSVRPVAAITTVTGIAADGTRFALPVDSYAIDLTADGAGRVQVFQSGSARRVAVRFTAGLAPEWAVLPEGLRHGILRLAAHNYRQRDREDAGPPPASVVALWRPWRRMRLG